MYIGDQPRHDPGKAAVVIADTGEALTYGELEDAAERLARVLRATGLGPGDVVAVLSLPSLAVYEVYWAARRLGLTVTSVDRSLSVTEAAFVVNDSGARAIFVADDAEATGASLEAITPYVEHRYSRAPGHGWQDAAEPTDDEPVPRADGAELFYSAGTTGRPRPGMLAGTGPGARPGRIAAILDQICTLGEDTVLFTPTPLSDPVAAQAARAVHDAGGTVVTLGRFSPDAALQAIAQYGATVLHFVTPVLIRLLKLPTAARDRCDISTVTAVLHSSAPCPLPAKRSLMDWFGPVLHEVYGGAECEALTFIDAQQWLARPGSVGTAVSGNLHVCDGSGAEQPAGELGLVYLDGLPEDPAVGATTWSAEARHPRHRDWGTLGDLGYLDGDGFLFLVDRQSSLIDVGDVTVYPRLLEQTLVLHPKVADAAVIGIPDDRLGQQVRAVVQVATGVRAGPAVQRELLAFLRGRVASKLPPCTVDFADAIPRSGSGKLVKRKLTPRFSLSDGLV
jgi:fatty-acyl-CoA synthase